VGGGGASAGAGTSTSTSRGSGTGTGTGTGAGLKLAALVDGGPEGNRALAAMIRKADDLTHKKEPHCTFIVHAVDLLSSVPMDIVGGPVYPYAHVFVEIGDQLRTKGKSLLATYKKQHPSSTTVLLADYNTDNAIEGFLKEHKIDVVFVGTRGQGALSRFFFGSCSDAIAHQSLATTNVYIAR